MKKKIIIPLVILSFIVFFFLRKSPINPVFYQPDEPMLLEGVLKPNEALDATVFLGEGRLDGPESIAIDKNGDIYTGTGNGWVIRVSSGGNVEKYFETGGRNLGLKFSKTGSLILCNSYKGLLELTPDKTLKVLTASSDGVPFRFTDDLAISSDGKIYFSDASDTFGQEEYLYDLLESRPHGRLLVYDPETGETKTLLKNIHFANGVALSRDEDFLLLNETYRYRVIRYWLKGEKKGQSEIFIKNLPGFPDNITSNQKGEFYIALYTIRDSTLDFIQKRPFLSSQIAKIPHIFWPKPKSYGFVIQISSTGEILNSFQDSDGSHFSLITSAIEREGYLYLGSLLGSKIGKFRLP